jgi:hypothetical protein
MDYSTYDVTDLFVRNMLLREAKPEDTAIAGVVRFDEVKPDDAIATARQIISAFWP